MENELLTEDEKVIKENIELEKKHLQGLSKDDLLEYIANNRISLMYAFVLINKAGEAIAKLQKQLGEMNKV